MSEPFWTPLGAAAVDYVGAWAAGTQYVPGQVVRYQGIDYLAVNPSLGVTPPSSTFPAIPPGTELAYGESAVVTSVATSNTEAAPLDLIVLPAIVLDGITPILVEFFAYAANPGGATGTAMTLNLWDVNTDLGRLWRLISGSASAAVGPVYGRSRRFTPASGSHTYRCRAWASGTNPGTIDGSVPGMPAYLRVVKA